jgi:hypothetical protein
MDYEFAIEIERTRTAMARDGLDHETIEAWISDRALAFAEERTEHLDGLAAALLKQDGRLN